MLSVPILLTIEINYHTTNVLLNSLQSYSQETEK